MKKITKTMNIYVAFDGKEFITEKECVDYEKRVVRQLPMFNIDIPFMSDDDNFAAYYINSQDNFELLIEYLECVCDNVYCESYEKPQWIFVHLHDEIYAEIFVLNTIMQQLANAMNTIYNNTLKLRKENK